MMAIMLAGAQAARVELITVMVETTEEVMAANMTVATTMKTLDLLKVPKGTRKPLGGDK
jgi:uncharacterized cupredoxin-like copper-binding protein